MKNIIAPLPAEFDIHPLRVEFRNKDVERNFQAHHLPRNQATLRTTLVFCSFFYLAFALTDASVLGYTSETLLLFFARMFVAVTAMTGLYLARTRPASSAVLQLAATAAEIVGMGLARRSGIPHICSTSRSRPLDLKSNCSSQT